MAFEPKKALVPLYYQNYIDLAPQAKAGLYSQACANDSTTIDSWRNVWISQIKENHKRYGPFKDRAINQIFGKYAGQAAICAGSGPSLKENAHLLNRRGNMPLVSCLHNFHFLEDIGCPADYYVTLDAGPVTVEEVSEGGKKSASEYWELTKDRTLLAYIGTHPELLERWQGKVLFFNCPIPDQVVTQAVDGIEPFGCYVSTGGNVLGASTYLAKAILGCPTLIFVGASFSFGYDEKFHAWDSKYDANKGVCLRVTDIFGNKVTTWQSYFNFKAWFDWLAETVPGIYINASEGGIMGAYNDGNIRSIKQMPLEAALRMLTLSEEMREAFSAPEKNIKKILF